MLSASRWRVTQLCSRLSPIPNSRTIAATAWPTKTRFTACIRYEAESLNGLRLVAAQRRVNANAIEFGLLVEFFADRQPEVFLGVRSRPLQTRKVALQPLECILPQFWIAAV